MTAERYQILKRLGEGGGGTIYEGFDTQLRRPVAIKRLTGTGTDDDEDRLRKEAATLASLRHPNIVTIFDVSGDEDGLFLVMELLDAPDLWQWVETQPPTLPDFFQIASGLLDALVAAHSQSLLHRDIKPENIKVQHAHGGRLLAKLLDFGLARVAVTAMKQTVDKNGRILGSIHYMAPEQFRRQTLDGRTDLYMLGCTLYEVLAHKKAFHADNVAAIMDRHLKHLVTPLNECRPDLPPKLCQWVMWLINHDKELRPESAQAALQSLKAIFAELPGTNTTTAAQTTTNVVRPPTSPRPAVTRSRSMAVASLPVTLTTTKSAPVARSRALMIGGIVAVLTLGAWLASSIGGGRPWIELFNGRDLSGWNYSPGRWTVLDGAIVSQHGRDGFADLEHPQVFGDFIMEVEFMLPDAGTNTGVYFRSTDPIWNPWNRKLDYQADIMPGWTGMLYAGPRDLIKEGLVAQPAPDVAPNTWHVLRITARGSHLQVQMDGVLILQFDDTNIQKRRLQGTVRLEHNSLPVHFRSVRVRPL